MVFGYPGDRTAEQISAVVQLYAQQQTFPAEGMGEHTWTEVSYRWSVSGDVLRVLVVGTNASYGGFDALGCVSCKVYNISVSQGRLLRNDELYAASGVEQVRERVTYAIVCSGADAKTAAMPEAFQGPYETAMLRSCIMAERPDLNFLAAQPCLDETGQLCVGAMLYTGLGNGWYWDYICVADWDTPLLTSSSAYHIMIILQRFMAHESDRKMQEPPCRVRQGGSCCSRGMEAQSASRTARR